MGDQHTTVRPLGELIWLTTIAAATALVWWLADLGPTWRLARVPLDLLAALLALFVVHELLHLLMARLAGVPTAGLGLRLGHGLLRVTVTQRPGPRAWVACALAPCLVLSVALLVPLLRSGDPFWLVLLAVHLGSCRADWGLARRARARAPDLPDRLLPAAATLLLMAGLALTLPGLPASLWLRADQIVCVMGERAAPSPPGAGAPISWRFRSGGARALVLTWTTRQGTAVASTVEHDLQPGRDHGTLAVRFDPGTEDPARPCLWVSLDDEPPARLELGDAADLPAGASLCSLEPLPLRTDRDALLVTRLRAAAGDLDRGSPTAAQLAGCATLTLRLSGGD